MLDLLGIASILHSVKEIVSESLEKEIPAENWANKELKHEDIMNGVAINQVIKYAKEGRYKLDQHHSKLCRDEKGEIIIDYRELYKEDLKLYGINQTYEWLKQGKYNTPK